jgi:hypothetical protein
MVRIAWVILIFNLLLIVGVIFLYFVRRDKYQRRDLERFCSELPLNGELPDPYVLKDGEWVKHCKPDGTPAP